jgi:hypothetical protein
MSEPTTTEPTLILDPLLDIPIPPVQLVCVWQEAAEAMAKQGEAAAAGAFIACTRQLSAWIKHEGSHVMMRMPREMSQLIMFAMQFDQTDKDDWRRLAGLAKACQNGGTA